MAFFLNARSLHADSYTIPVIHVEVAIQADGSVRITEHRTYRFDGDFSWADYRLPLRGFTAIRNIRLTENGTSYINRNSEDPGTFLVERSDEQIRVKWFYEAEDEERTFTLSYTLEGALVVGHEWVEFFWNYLGAHREKDTDSLSVRLQLPRPVAADSLFVWERGPGEKISLDKTANGYAVSASDLDDDESVRIRSVFPRTLFESGALSTTDRTFSLAGAQADEQAYRQQREEQRVRDARYAAYGLRLLIVSSILGIAAFLFFYQKYGRRHAVAGGLPTETVMIPGRMKPAVAGWLVQGRTIHSGHLMATLLDLARRRYLTIREQEPEEQWLGDAKKIFTIEKNESPDTGSLTAWEASLYSFISEQIEQGNNRLDKLFSASSTEAHKWFSQWKKKLQKDCQERGWYDEQSRKGMYANIAAQLFMLAGAVIGTIWAGPEGTIGIAITLLLLAASAAIIRRTPEGEKAYRQWKAYRDGLKNARKHGIEADMLDRHFIYAVAFALSEKDIKHLFSACDAPSTAFYWFIFYGHGTHTGAPADVAATFSTLGASGVAAFPGASAGAAGGASAGAAGGGAAGGAG